jgi:hypothetical protein
VWAAAAMALVQLHCTVLEHREALVDSDSAKDSVADENAGLTSGLLHFLL